MAGRIRTLFPKLAGKYGGYAAKFFFPDERESWWTRDYGVFAYGEPGKFKLQHALDERGEFDLTAPAASVVWHLTPGRVVEVTVTRITPRSTTVLGKWAVKIKSARVLGDGKSAEVEYEVV
jgi:hypothetical protein